MVLLEQSVCLGYVEFRELMSIFVLHGLALLMPKVVWLWQERGQAPSLSQGNPVIPEYPLLNGFLQEMVQH